MNLSNRISAWMTHARLVRLVLDGGIIATLFIAIGSLMDTPVHIFREHSPLEPAHLFIIASAFFYSLGGGLAILALRRAEGEIKKCLWYVFAGGTTIFIAIVPFDEMWHIFFGLDENAWTPPHLMFWIGILIELWGLMLLAHYSAKKLLVITAAMITIMLFLIYEFDLPAAAGLEKDLPGFAYAGAGTLVFVTGFMMIRVMVDSPFFLLLTATVAWLFFWLTGSTIEVIWGASFILTPFPIMVQALCIDLSFLGLLKGARRRSLLWLLLASMVVGAVSYWSMVAWATLFTKLPQQISGGPEDWIIWFMMLAPGFALIPSFIAWQLTKRVRTLTASS